VYNSLLLFTKIYDRIPLFILNAKNLHLNIFYLKKKL